MASEVYLETPSWARGGLCMWVLRLPAVLRLSTYSEMRIFGLRISDYENDHGVQHCGHSLWGERRWSPLHCSFLDNGLHGFGRIMVEYLQNCTKEWMI